MAGLEENVAAIGVRLTAEDIRTHRAGGTDRWGRGERYRP
jgi:hypothetical protein